MISFIPMFFCVMPASIGMLIYAPFQIFEWPTYFVIGAIFTVLLFSQELSAREARIFSKKNARSSTAVVLIHLAFLSVLLGFMMLAPYIKASLPNWLTDTFNARGSEVSIFDIFFIFGMIGLHLIERRCVYVESEEDVSGTEGSSRPRA
ncbi:MAG: hypothetical protein RB191_00765 [Terriglobia bacterium]|nr:hypothetical protein [Terriglobia bacterium]